MKKKEFEIPDKDEEPKKPNWALQNSLSTVSLGRLGEDELEDEGEIVA